MDKSEIISAIRDAIDIINMKIESDADRHYSTYILDSSYQGDYVQAYKDRGWCSYEVGTIQRLQSIIYEMEGEE